MIEFNSLPWNRYQYDVVFLSVNDLNNFNGLALQDLEMEEGGVNYLLYSPRHVDEVFQREMRSNRAAFTLQYHTSMMR